MPVVIVLVGLILMVAAFQNTQGTLATNLETDLPGFGKWGASLAAVGAVGYIPGMQTISRWLLALVGVVLVLQSYRANQNIFAAIASQFTAPASTVGQSVTTPAAAYVANPAQPAITSSEVTGTTAAAATGNVNAVATPAVTPANPYDPATYLANFAQGAVPAAIVDAALSGFGGVA